MFFTGIAGIILSSLLTTPVPSLIGRLTDNVLLGNKSIHALLIYVCVIAVLYLLDYGVSVGAQNLFVKINNSVVNELRYAVMGKVLDLPMSYLSTTEKNAARWAASSPPLLSACFLASSALCSP